MRTLRRFIIALLILGTTVGLPSWARAQACAANTPHLIGEWITLPYQMPINPISATLLHTGRY
jgi:hypothetical protein